MQALKLEVLSQQSDLPSILTYVNKNVKNNWHVRVFYIFLKLHSWSLLIIEGIDTDQNNFIWNDYILYSCWLGMREKSEGVGVRMRRILFNFERSLELCSFSYATKIFYSSIRSNPNRAPGKTTEVWTEWPRACILNVAAASVEPCIHWYTHSHTQTQWLILASTTSSKYH